MYQHTVQVHPLLTDLGKKKNEDIRTPHSYQHVAVLDVEVEEEEEGDEEAEEGDGGALPQAPHLVQGFPQQPHDAAALSGTCRGTGREKLKIRRHPGLFFSVCLSVYVVAVCVEAEPLPAINVIIKHRATRE